MGQQIINVGTSPNDGDGNPIRTSFIKCNSNFSELYARVQTTPPPTLIGTTGDSAGMYAYDSSYFYYCFADYDGSSTIWGQVPQTSTVSINQIVSGNSSVNIPTANSNVTVTVGGISNVAVFSTGGANIIGFATIQGNLTGANLLTPGLSSIGGNVTGGNIFTSGLISAAGNVRGGNINTAGLITATGNITGGNLRTAGIVTITPVPFADLTAVAGGRAIINNANLVATGNFGANVSGGGSNTVPVWSDGTNWYIG